MKHQTPWSHKVKLADVRGDMEFHLAADPEARRRIARLLDLADLHLLEADLTLRPWMDGVELSGRWRARIEQTCGVSLEAFESELAGELLVHAVPPESPQAPHPEEELVLDLERDPPDVLEGDEIDIACYVVEYLALDLDPFPRKPGVEFEPPPAEPEASPFDVLRQLRTDDPR